jgi:outer membrane protein OmpA-like peptidoglycan-associated protein
MRKCEGQTMKPSYQPYYGSRFLVIVAPIACALAVAACSQPSSPSGTAPPAAASAQTSSAPSDVQLYFEDSSSALSATANQKLDQVARLYREGNPVVMFVTGHADSRGSEYPNLLLSADRAKAAKEALVARGIPSTRLQLQAMGSSLPRDPNMPPPQDNRRVVITWR